MYTGPARRSPQDAPGPFRTMDLSINTSRVEWLKQHFELEGYHGETLGDLRSCTDCMSMPPKQRKMFFKSETESIHKMAVRETAKAMTRSNCSNMSTACWRKSCVLLGFSSNKFKRTNGEANAIGPLGADDIVTVDGN